MSSITGQKKPLKITLPNLLDSPDFFVCKQFNCIMSKISCVKRQQKSQQLKFFLTDIKITQLSLQQCNNCSQGKQIKRELKKNGGCN